jgi:hypothetical protein
MKTNLKNQNRIYQNKELKLKLGKMAYDDNGNEKEWEDIV